MVEINNIKYVILADSNNIEPFVIPRQLTKINNETLIERMIRLLKDNGVKDIIITSHDKRFDNLGAKRYEPLYNDYNPRENKGYWLNAFPIELLNEKITFLFGDVYYSEKAIKTIVNSKEDDLFFCTYQNKDKRYIKHHDEPLAYKVIDYENFKKGIEAVKKMYDDGLTGRHPIVWELYRYLNGINVNTHELRDNCVIINDESCDIDSVKDIQLLEFKIGGNNMIKLKATKDFSLERFDELKNIVRVGKEEKGKLYIGDIFECSKEIAEYLLGGNDKNIIVAEIIEVEPIPETKTIKIEAVKQSKKKKAKK